MKTWKCTVKHLHTDAIVRAETRGKATQTTMLSAQKVGYKCAFTDIKTRRAREFDGLKLRPGICYNPDYNNRRNDDDRT